MKDLSLAHECVHNCLMHKGMCDSILYAHMSVFPCIWSWLHYFYPYLPTYLLTYLPTYLPSYLHTYVNIYHRDIYAYTHTYMNAYHSHSAYLPTLTIYVSIIHLPIYLSIYPSIHLPTSLCCRHLSRASVWSTAVFKQVCRGVICHKTPSLSQTLLQRGRPGLQQSGSC